MTRDEFEQRYSKDNSETLALLRKHGRFAIPCDCGHPTCAGWQMASIFTGTPEERQLIAINYPEEVASIIGSDSVELYKIAAEINERYA
jgi:hypothetical protein